ncbi:MAG: phosphoribosyltransferase family protein [Fusobacteriaceae bacterium]|jgi:hypothetical protein|nr:phosphoribosyltransferase family protein [Fusobacteriaceae bacterium]
MNKEYKIEQLVKVAKRDNNSKRPYLLVNPLQGKHIPVEPSSALELFKSISDKVNKNYPNERLLVIGFAETATAIGAVIACNSINGSYYIQTTRENLKNSDYLYFTESHSHATEQKLIQNNLDTMIANTDRIIFAEDEITTGNTIFELFNILKEKYKNRNLHFGISSILNGITKESLEKFEKNNIKCLYIKKLEKFDYENILSKYSYDTGCKMPICMNDDKKYFKEISVFGNSDPRIGILSSEYFENCKIFSTKILNNYEKNQFNNKSVLVLGAEEFMYPAMVVGAEIERISESAEVKFHAFTRSPILPSKEDDYPLHVRYELLSIYNDKRTTYIYNIKKYDKVIILHDSENFYEKSFESIFATLNDVGCDDIDIYRWSV